MGKKRGNSVVNLINNAKAMMMDENNNTHVRSEMSSESDVVVFGLEPRA
jgi:hypothetical protein